MILHRKRLTVFLVLITLLCSFSRQLKAAERLVYQIRISGVIDLGLAGYVKRIVKEAEAAGAEAVLLVINTPGGRVDAAVQICDVLLTTSLKTYSFIDSQAISAGAMIALSTSAIGMTDYATIGDIEPQPTSEKALSYIRGRLKAVAEKFDRPANILEAMADQDIEIDPLTTKGKLITLSTEEALRYKVAEFKASDVEEFLRQLGYLTPVVKESAISWAEKFVRILTHPVVSPMLLSLGFLGIFMEIKTPGFGFPGAVGLTCLVLFFGGHILVGLAGWEAAFLFGLGLLFSTLEIFVIPGFGVAGIIGIVTITASIFLALSGVGHIPIPLIDYSRALNSLAVAVTVTGAAVYLILKNLPSSALWRKIVLTENVGAVTTSDGIPIVAPGALGVTSTPLRPAGKVLIDGKPYDAVTEGEFINVGVEVKVVELSGNRMVVRKEGS